MDIDQNLSPRDNTKYRNSLESTIRINYNDLTGDFTGMMVNKGIHSQMAVVSDPNSDPYPYRNHQIC